MSLAEFEALVGGFDDDDAPPPAAPAPAAETKKSTAAKPPPIPQAALKAAEPKKAEVKRPGIVSSAPVVYSAPPTTSPAAPAEPPSAAFPTSAPQPATNSLAMQYAWVPPTIPTTPAEFAKSHDMAAHSSQIAAAGGSLSLLAQARLAAQGGAPAGGAGGPLKKKKFLRAAAGKVWEDATLADWDADDHRIFAGDLGNEVNDQVLAKAFQRYPSFLRAKIVRDKHTNKTKGYGFVSFKDPRDCANALKEMQGAYVGNRPIKLRKSTWNKRDLSVQRKKPKFKRKAAAQGTHVPSEETAAAYEAGEFDEDGDGGGDGEYDPAAAAGGGAGSGAGSGAGWS